MKLTWEKTKEEKYRAGFRKMLRKFFVLPSGKKQDYDIFDQGKTAAVLALTPTKKVILIKVFRPGPEKILMEMPGGFIDKEEDPKDAISRELLEETGYKGEMKFVNSFVDDAYSNRIRHCFVAKNCKKVGKPMTDEEDEKFTEIIEMPLAEFRKHLRSGNLSDVKEGYIALDHLNLL